MVAGLRAVGAAVVALGLTIALGGPAAAEGSVPSEVATFVADGSLVAQLADVYGPDGSGGGIAFDADTTTAGPIERIHTWSAAFLAGESRDHPVDLLNEWAVPVALDEELVGVAIVWINPDSVRPELASFDADVPLAAALLDLPDGAALVRDPANAAWLTVDGEGLVTPLIPGSTGLETPVPLDDIAIVAPEPVTAPPSGGSGIALAVVLVLLAAISAALLIPRLRRRPEEGEPTHHHGPGHPAEHRADAAHPAEPEHDAAEGAGVDGDTRPIPVVAETAPVEEAEDADGDHEEVEPAGPDEPADDDEGDDEDDEDDVDEGEDDEDDGEGEDEVDEGDDDDEVDEEADEPSA